MNGCSEENINNLLNIKFTKMDLAHSKLESPNRSQKVIGGSCLPKLTAKTLYYLQNSAPFKNNPNKKQQLFTILKDKENFQECHEDITNLASKKTMTEQGWQKIVGLILDLPSPSKQEEEEIILH